MNKPQNPRITSFRKDKSGSGRKSRLSLTRGTIRRYLWVAPVLAMVALAIAGTFVRERMESAIQDQIGGELKALRDADVAALRLWLKSQKANAAVQAQAFREPVVALLDEIAAGKRSRGALLDSPQRTALDNIFKEIKESLGYVGYVILDRDMRVIASNEEELIGKTSPPPYHTFAREVLAGTSLISHPYLSTVELEDEMGRLSRQVPTMFTGGPVYADAPKGERANNGQQFGKAVAVLALRIAPHKEFSEILNVARFGTSGETYAFDKTGLMLSQSRFDPDLKRIGLLADAPNSRSVLTIRISDPEVDMMHGARPAKPRSEQSLTFMAKSAISGKPGVSTTGYRDYRGVDTVGAWAWLKDYDLGVATEVDKAEAYRPVYIMRTAFWTLFGLLSLAGVSLFGLTLLAGRMERRMREAVIAAGQVGQYTLEQKIGEGGMGSVYRGRHAMLRRPTAIKMLEPSRTTDVAVARFEREVQLTSELNHPNTITIYDYGRTQEGVFYYAMEYLEGLSLQTLVEEFGPQPDGRVINLLTQVCGSLQEAHTLGLIHRDIKPANIMLTQKGGMPDFVKLLDFGLVKAVDSRQQRVLTAANAVTGTPLYIPPEIVQDPDLASPSSDLYSLGAVAYFLLTGHPVFDAANVMEIIRQHVTTPPVPPSKRTTGPISPDLERLVLACLAKNPAERPPNAAQVAEALALCVPAQPWIAAKRDAWWKRYPSGQAPQGTMVANTREIDVSATMVQPAPSEIPKA